MLRVANWKLTGLVLRLMPVCLWSEPKDLEEPLDFERFPEIRRIKIGMVTPKPSNKQLLACQRGFETLINAGYADRKDDLGLSYFAIIRYTKAKATIEHLQNFVETFVDLKRSYGWDDIFLLTGSKWYSDTTI